MSSPAKDFNPQKINECSSPNPKYHKTFLQLKSQHRPYSLLLHLGHAEVSPTCHNSCNVHKTDPRSSMHHLQRNPNQELKDNIEPKVFYPAARKNNSCPLFQLFISFLYHWDKISWKESQIAPNSHKQTNTGKNSDSGKNQTQSCNVSFLLAAFIFSISTQVLSAKDLVQHLVLSKTFFFLFLCLKKLNDLSKKKKKSSKMAAEPGTEARNLTCSSLLRS